MNRLSNRVQLVGLILLVITAISIACGQEAIEPTPSVPASDVVAPPAASATALPPTATEAPAVPALGPTADPTIMPTADVPTPTQPAASDRRPSGGGASLVLLRSSSAAAPSGPGSIGGFNLSPAPQTFAAQGSLTVSAIGSVTVAADEARVVVIPEMNYGPSGPEQLSDRDREEIRANLASLGVGEDAVDFDGLGRYDPVAISVKLSVEDSSALGESIVDQVEEVVRRSESFGVRFSLSDENCDKAISLARREAAPAAEKAADDLADALGVERGAVNGALEYPLQTDPYRWLGAALNRCGGDASHRFAALLPFDSEPEVEVSVGLQVSYDLH